MHCNYIFSPRVWCTICRYHTMGFALSKWERKSLCLQGGFRWGSDNCGFWFIPVQPLLCNQATISHCQPISPPSFLKQFVYLQLYKFWLTHCDKACKPEPPPPSHSSGPQNSRRTWTNLQESEGGQQERVQRRATEMTKWLENHGVIQSLRLENNSRITLSNHWPILTMPTKPCSSVPNLHSSGTPPRMVTLPLPWADCANAWPLLPGRKFSCYPTRICLRSLRQLSQYLREVSLFIWEHSPWDLKSKCSWLHLCQDPSKFLVSNCQFKCRSHKEMTVAVPSHIGSQMVDSWSQCKFLRSCL